MAAEEFNPIDHARPPREEGWEEETEQVIEAIRNRGDLRIGQLIINAISEEVTYPDRPEKKEITELSDEEAEEYVDKLKKHEAECKAAIEREIWSIEADKLAELLQDFLGDEE